MTDNKKLYILDTNVLISDPRSIYSFKDSLIAIPIFALEELDKIKAESSERAFNARSIIRTLDLLRLQGSLKSGIDIGNNTILKIIFLCPECQAKESDFIYDTKSIDNKILLLAQCLKDQGHEIEFISKDINARVKADIINIETHDYSKEALTQENIYKGWIRLSVPAIELKKAVPEILLNLEKENKLLVNQFIVLESQNNPLNYELYRYLGNSENINAQRFKNIKSTNLNLALEPKNVEQLMALDLLLDESIKLVTLLGPAGTGKTFLVLLAGLDQVLIKNEYTKILVTRPIIPLGPDIGYLPGDIQEKLLSWMQPVYDNMDFIAHALGAKHSNIYRDNNLTFNKNNQRYRKNNKYKDFENKDKNIFKNRFPTLDTLLRENKLSLEAITYMRGRSIPYQYILIDEVQNLTPHEVKTLITRVGQGSKIILAGDPYQIDSLYLDFMNNGLVTVTEKFKGQNIFGSVYLQTSERSELSRLAAEIL